MSPLPFQGEETQTLSSDTVLGARSPLPYQGEETQAETAPPTTDDAKGHLCCHREKKREPAPAETGPAPPRT